MSNLKNLPLDRRLSSLTPFIDENRLLRVRGRVERSPGENSKFEPLILDTNHPVTKLLIEHYHVKTHHTHHETVINELRQNYWILGIRRCFQSIVNKCTGCCLLRASPYIPKMVKLPQVRLGFHFGPFTYCGLDYFGPIMARIRRRHEKRWGALFTFLIVRAIHIELADSISTDFALMAIQRFAAWRGFPAVIFSDNGANFRGSSQELKDMIEILNDDNIKRDLTSFVRNNNFEWRFNSPAMPNGRRVREDIAVS